MMTVNMGHVLWVTDTETLVEFNLSLFTWDEYKRNLIRADMFDLGTVEDKFIVVGKYEKKIFEYKGEFETAEHAGHYRDRVRIIKWMRFESNLDSGNWMAHIKVSERWQVDDV